MGERWAAPENSRLIFDFRPLPSQSDYTYRDRPYAVFASESLGSEYELLAEGGNLQDCLLTQATKDLLASRLGASVEGDTLHRGISDLMQRGDPTGDENHRPLVKGTLEGIEEQNTIARQLDVVRHDIRERYLAEVDADAPADARRRALGSYCKKYNIEFAEYKALLLPDIRDHHEPPLEPGTIVYHAFGSSTDLTVQSGTWSVTGGVCKKTGGGNAYHTIYHDDDMSSDDHAARCIQASYSVSRFAAVICRHPGSADTGYFNAQWYASGMKMYGGKLVSGTRTDLNANVSNTGGTGIAVRADGSDVRYWYGNANASSTDTAITGNTKCGLMQWDDSTTNTCQEPFLFHDELTAVGSDETIDAAESFTGSWTNYLSPGFHAQSGEFNACGSGSDKADYSFTVTSGNNYKVSVSWSAFSNRPNDAPYTLSGVVGGPKTEDVDQNVPPQDFAREDSASNFPNTFKTVWASEEADGTTLTVQLTDNCQAGQYVTADAVLIEDLGAASSTVPAAIHHYKMAGGL